MLADSRGFLGGALHQLPVFETAGRAYQFLLRDAGTILRLSWLPMLVVTVVQYFALRAHIGAMRAALEAGNAKALAGLAPLWGWHFANSVVALVGGAIVAVALHRVILLGDRHPGRFAHLAFGRVEALFALLPLILLVPTILVTFVVALLAAATMPRSFASLFVVLLVWSGFIFVMIRFQPIFPLTVLERRYNFAEAWSLTRGNFWRLLALWVVVLIPVALVASIFSLLTSPLGGQEQGAAKNVATVLEQAESMVMVQTIFSFVWSIVGGALVVGVLSYSYKALSGRHPDDVWIPES